MPPGHGRWSRGVWPPCRRRPCRPRERQRGVTGGGRRPLRRARVRPIVVSMIRPATVADTPTIARLIRGLAEYERLADEVALDEDRLREHLFGPRPFAEV